MKQSKLLSLLLAVVSALILLTGSIAAPILCRPFYYAHIGPMALCEQTGWSEEQIKTAYNEMMDFCLGKAEFSTGDLRWSEEGRQHFIDVRQLFLLDLRVLTAAVLALVGLLLLAALLRRRPAPLGRKHFLFWSGSGLAAVFVVVGALAATDFDRAFTVFHQLFFPGKTNWLFDPDTDEIIRILPQDFFMHCAILILVLLLLGCVIFLLQKPRKRD